MGVHVLFYNRQLLPQPTVNPSHNPCQVKDQRNEGLSQRKRRGRDGTGDGRHEGSEDLRDHPLRPRLLSSLDPEEREGRTKCVVEVVVDAGGVQT